MPSAKGKRGGNATTKKPKRSSMPRKSAASNGGKKKVSKGASFADSGATLGSHVGGMLGRLGAGLISKITGYGSYEVSRNSISNGNAIPSFYNDGDGVVVCHREYLTDLNGSTPFTLTSYPVNVGLVKSFPWLSTIATQFEEYEMLGLVYEFRPLSGMAVSTSSASLGCVIYATDYNPYNPVFPNKQSMESYEYSTSTVPFNEMMHPVECKPGSNVLSKRFIRSGSVTDGTLQMYDLGNFQVATTGMQSTYVVGELWVSYHVRLTKPRLDLTPIAGSALFATSPVGTGTAAQPQGTAGFLTSYNTIPSIVMVKTIATQGRGVTFTASGFYYMVITNTQAGLLTGAPTWILGANIALAPLPYLQAGVPQATLLAANATQGITVLFLQCVTAGTTSDNFVAVFGGAGTLASSFTIQVFALPFSAPTPV